MRLNRGAVPHLRVVALCRKREHVVEGARPGQQAAQPSEGATAERRAADAFMLRRRRHLCA